jgi:hypothetical protein
MTGKQKNCFYFIVLLNYSLLFIVVVVELAATDSKDLKSSLTFDAISSSFSFGKTHLFQSTRWGIPSNCASCCLLCLLCFVLFRFVLDFFEFFFQQLSLPW